MAQGIFTLIVMISFLGIVFWAYSKRRRHDFDEAANLPLREDHGPLDTKATHKRAGQ